MFGFVFAWTLLTIHLLRLMPVTAALRAGANRSSWPQRGLSGQGGRFLGELRVWAHHYAESESMVR